MKSTINALLISAAMTAATAAGHVADDLDLGFDSGVSGWRVVVDGVMGGRSTGRVILAEPGVMLFSGDLSLENNGGFSQVRTAVTGEAFEGAEGIELRVRGDGRKYNFDIRCSNVRMMAGGFQTSFETEKDEWTTIRLPFTSFGLYSFGRPVPNAPALEPTLIESVGFTLSDKNPGSFRLEIDSIRSYGSESGDAQPSDGDLASTARDAGLNTLLELVAASGLELPEGQKVTIFAPTDEAFAALPEATVEGLLKPEGLATLRSILTYHVSSPAYGSADLLSRRSIETLNGQRLTIDVDGTVSIGDAGLVATDVSFDGGIVHVIDRVLMPELNSIGELAASTDNLTTLATAVDAAGLGEQLSSANGPWTVFAPVNSAFGQLPQGALDSLLMEGNRRELIGVLGLHVIPGRLYLTDLLSNRQAQTLFGDSVEFSIENGQLRVGDATIIATDIEAANGVVHLIDSVLLPTIADTEASAFSSSARAEAARLCELAVNRGAPLFNAGQVAGCAAVYEVTLEALLAMGRDRLGRDIIQRLEMGLAEAETESAAVDRAWVYRRTLDDVYELMTTATSGPRADSTR